MLELFRYIHNSIKAREDNEFYMNNEFSIEKFENFIKKLETFYEKTKNSGEKYMRNLTKKLRILLKNS